jgi:hypothetical protein
MTRANSLGEGWPMPPRIFMDYLLSPEEVLIMAEGIIDMEDMEVIFSVTDTLGIHRESVRVELVKEDPGSVVQGKGGMVEITVPESGSIKEFSQRLSTELEELGYTHQEPEDNDEWP